MGINFSKICEISAMRHVNYNWRKMWKTLIRDKTFHGLEDSVLQNVSSLQITCRLSTISTKTPSFFPPEFENLILRFI